MGKSLATKGRECARQLEAEGIASMSVVRMVDALADELEQARDDLASAKRSHDHEVAFLKKQIRTLEKAKQLDAQPAVSP